eukprot:NODE_99_length_20465_cov_0.827654.p10 type:complete len:201 gc:universal NODE_99_length_20465_cov_0.827654:5015-4413(-)
MMIVLALFMATLVEPITCPSVPEWTDTQLNAYDIINKVVGQVDLSTVQQTVDAIKPVLILKAIGNQDMEPLKKHVMELQHLPLLQTVAAQLRQLIHPDQPKHVLVKRNKYWITKITFLAIFIGAVALLIVDESKHTKFSKACAHAGLGIMASEFTLFNAYLLDGYELVDALKQVFQKCKWLCGRTLNVPETETETGASQV